MSKLFYYLLLALFVSGCNPSYFIPPKDSFFKFSIGELNYVWKSQGFEAVGDERDIQFYTKNPPSSLVGDNLIIWIKKPVSAKVFTEKNTRIEFFNSESDSRFSVLDSTNSKTKIKLDLKKWSTKPRGLIEGEIIAYLYDSKGKGYKMVGHFIAYQALGTINDFH